MRFLLIAAGIMAGTFLIFFISAAHDVQRRPGETVEQYALRWCGSDLDCVARTVRDANAR